MMEASIWHFRAEADPSRVHTVTKSDDGYTCTCPVFSYSKPKDCRHVRLVQNGLAGLPVNEEPELVWGAVEHVQKYRGRVLVPFLSDENQEALYRVLWELRQLGISKRKCCEFLGVRGVSDAVVETFLRSKGLMSGEGSNSSDDASPAHENQGDKELTWPVSSRVEEVEPAGVGE